MNVVPDPKVWMAGPPDDPEFNSAFDEAERLGWEELYELMTDDEISDLDDFEWITEKLEAYMKTDAKTWKDIDAYLLEAVRERVGEVVLAERIARERKEMAG